MITTVASIEDDSVRDFMALFRSAPQMQDTHVGVVGVPTADLLRVSLPDFNVLGSTIVASDGTPVVGYRPVEGDTMVSDVILGTPLSVGATFSYTTTKVTFRSRKTPRVQMALPLKTPRIIVLYSGATPVSHYRQSDDSGSHVLRQSLFMTLLFDTDDMTGGPNERSLLAGTARAIIEMNLAWLFDQGYEQIVAHSISADIPDAEGIATMYRGAISLGMVINPRVF
jgi:hypothetical protein